MSNDSHGPHDTSILLQSVVFRCSLFLPELGLSPRESSLEGRPSSPFAIRTLDVCGELHTEIGS